ncbi:hypothetical protein PG996_006271 [Apiospora saccharicola]|uniref:Uncharacterized protein n=1 Tax=Apiospora saccharicola TaxID=335842 RepID=A0ABR1VNZ3_9PEZI
MKLSAVLRVGVLPHPPPPPAPAAPKPPPPNDGDVRAHYHTIERNTCLFYAKVGTEAQVKKVRDSRDYLSGYLLLEDRWTDDWYKSAQKQMGGKKSAKKFFSMASRVLAQGCSGTVYVLLPEGKGHDWPTDTIWNNDEWPNLPPSANKIIRLNMNDASHQETIFEGPSAKKRRDTVDAIVEARGGSDDDQCSIKLTQWDHDKTDGHSDRFELEFDVTNGQGRVLGHQARVGVADWNPLHWLGGSLLSTGLIVIPNGDGRLGFWYFGGYWSTDDSRCQLGDWANDAGDARHREVNCHFTC